jgi:AraC-like DNA-binding protein
MPPLAPPEPKNSPACVLEHHQTEAFEPALRLEAWRAIAHPWVDFQPEPQTPLQAEIKTLSNERCVLGVSRSSAYTMATGSQQTPSGDMVALSLVQTGGLVPAAWPRKGAGSLSLCLLNEADSYQWEQNTQQVFLALPRDDVRLALGREPQTQLLSTRCTLAPVFASQLTHMALLLHQNTLDNTEAAALLHTTHELALLMLRNLGRQGHAIDDAQHSLHAGRYAAALRFMQQHAHRHDLDAQAIAHGAACSRTRLYEAFAAHEQTVMGALRDIRLMRAQGMLTEGGRLHVESLAWRCGFADASGFSKLFRARFGLSPREWYARACQTSVNKNAPDGKTP